MARAFSMTGSVRLSPQWTDDLNTTSVLDSTLINLALTLADGTGAGQANCYWKDVRTVSVNQSDTIALDDLPLKAFSGDGTLVLSALRLIYVRNLSATQRLTYVFDESQRSIALTPGGFFVWSGSVTLGGSVVEPTFSQTEIQISNGAGVAANYEILLVGVGTT